MKIGIEGIGFYVPRYRIRLSEIEKVWGRQAPVGVEEKSVACWDEDSLTMGIEAARSLFERVDTRLKRRVTRIFFGSESPIYAVNPTSTILAEYLGIEGEYNAYDTQFACKAGTGALVSALDLVKAGEGKALVVASDKALGRPRDALEFTAGSGAVALLVSKQKELLLEVLSYTSFSSDTPDFWRGAEEKFPSHFGRFTGEPAYFKHVLSAGRLILEKTGLKPQDFRFAVFHMPNYKFPVRAAKFLGFSFDQVKDSLIVKKIGNCYSASALLGLTAVLEKAKKGDLVFFVSYGSGAGSDAFVFKVGPLIDIFRPEVSTALEKKIYISYEKYLQFIEAI